MTIIREEMTTLINKLNEANNAYYNTDKEIMSNYEYDNLYDRLIALEKETGIVMSNSPTQNVGYEVLGSLEKKVHKYPAKSLDKTKDVNALKTFLARGVGALSWKLDGLTTVLTYSGGVLVDAVTRGNGIQGDSILTNAKTFKNIPLSIPYKDELIIRGETVISYDNFNKINEGLLEDEKYKNPRNLVAGSVRNLDSKVCASRNVDFIAFEVVEGLESTDSKTQKLEQIKMLGFDVVHSVRVTSENVGEVVKQFTNNALSYKYAADGLVLTYDSLSFSNTLGETSKFPLHSIAFKWFDELSESKLITVEWSTSRTGLINPVAIFEPVDIEGTTVERASLHNLDIFNALELGEGDVVTCYKANKIIPQIDDNLTRSNTLTIPEYCPACGAATEVRLAKTANYLHCGNINCSAKIIKALTHFVSRDCMNIDGLSEATLEKFVDAGIVNNIMDIYSLSAHKTTICKMDGMGLKSYNKLMMAIEKSKTVNMANFIYALGIPNVGLSTAKDLVKAYDNDINRIMCPIISDLVKIDGIGEVVAKDIYKFFVHVGRRNMVESLMDILIFEQPQEINVESSIVGKTFVITGDVHIFKNRKEVQAKLESMGAKVSGSVSKNTDYLINNDSESKSSKNIKALSCGVEIITEAQLLELIGGQ